MCTSYIIPACYVILVSVAVMGAPLAEKETEMKKRSVSPAAEVQDQEKDLQDLLSLVNKESHQNDVMVHKEDVSHFENNNGKTLKVEEKEEKVVDTNTGKVIADVKQEVKQEATGNEAKPETVVETKVDIPAEGVHESFVQEGEDISNNVGSENDLEPELTPADMAEYLYVTQKFDAFYEALDKLVNQSKMTAEDAEMYAKTVAIEYERLQLEDFEERFNEEKRFYPQVPPMADASDFYPQAGPVYAADDRYPAMDYFGYPAAYMTPEEQYLAQQQEMQGYPGDIDPYEFLAALWNEAYGKGNEEAQEIVKMLYDRVSQDDNPDDMGQIRDLLVETVAASLNEDPSFNYGMEEMMPANEQAELREEAEQELAEGGAKALEQLKEAEKKDEEKPETKQEEVKSENKVEDKAAKPEDNADKQKQ